jgi:NAD(P)H dehydrogenase (quinone)
MNHRLLTFELLLFSTHLLGHITAMSEAVKSGIEEAGATAEIFQVAETLPDEVLSKMGAPAKPAYPIITADKLTEFDGVMFGMSGRYGTYPAQMKAFMDSTGGLWQKGALVGKAGGVFVSTGTQGGGQETIGFSTVQFFAHHGMVFVPLGYTDPAVFSYDEPHGASPYGSGTFAGPDGSRQPSDLEKGVAKNHGKHFATIAAKLAK